MLALGATLQFIVVMDVVRSASGVCGPSESLVRQVAA